MFPMRKYSPFSPNDANNKFVFPQPITNTYHQLIKKLSQYQ